MRTKKISLLLALILAVSAIALPLTAYAAGDKDTTPPELTASLDGDTLKIESSDDHSGVEAVFVDGNRIGTLTNGAASVTLKDYAGTEKQVSVYAQDYAGNRSKAVKFENPYYEEPVPTEKPAAAAQQNQGGTAVKPAQAQAASPGSTNSNAGSSNADSNSSGNGSNAGAATGANGGSNTATGTNGGSSDSQEETETASAIPDGAFTPEGTGTVLDTATGADGDKQFYTITTEAGNVFYLIIDSKRDDNNVYFLNGVTEAGLIALAEKGNGSMSVIPAEDICICTVKCEAGEVNISCPVCKNDLKGCIGKEKPTETEEPAQAEQPKKDNGSAGTIIFLIIALLAVGGVGYYVKIVRPKQQAEDDEDFEDDGYGEGFDPDEAYGELKYLSEDDFDDKDSE
ncbi:bacteriocin [Enterocloster clostridioformis]|uniref:DUF4366 domain-containing protein n=1 Tax=Enterocloster clostridioformis TaxID=1531 RepID=UPI00080C5FB1|nr:DUF4366 domain-containing protein [Enterocloster clostridioformis]ANU49339.1 bacteriocin [Lachnoclostridium sp. YL32]NDO31827.1 DUF4366 domain-containing protein [Enterocloster clostridioformis]OXE64325.1 bacteriocin [Enterocloster clostridioformis]QQR01735.1 DUF4366 domain-containing protein [Enterocloster clostridioformis]